MATKVLVPRLGEGVDEVTVTKWLKQVGDSIKELEPLLEVNTDKVDTEIPAPASGTVLKIVARKVKPRKWESCLQLARQEKVWKVSMFPSQRSKVKSQLRHSHRP